MKSKAFLEAETKEILGKNIDPSTFLSASECTYEVCARVNHILLCKHHPPVIFSPTFVEKCMHVDGNARELT